MMKRKERKEGRKKEVRKRERKKARITNQNFHVCFPHLLYGLAKLLGHFLQQTTKGLLSACVLSDFAMVITELLP